MAKRASCMFAPQNAPREVGEYQWKESTHSLINKYKRVGPVGKCSSKTTAGGGDDQETLQKHSVRPVRSVNSSLKRGYSRSHKTRDIKSKKVMRRYRASVCVSAQRAATGSPDYCFFKIKEESSDGSKHLILKSQAQEFIE